MNSWETVTCLRTGDQTRQAQVTAKAARVFAAAEAKREDVGSVLVVKRDCRWLIVAVQTFTAKGASRTTRYATDFRCITAAAK